MEIPHEVVDAGLAGVIGLLAFLGKDVWTRLAKAASKLESHEARVATIEKSTLGKSIDDHEQRIRTLENVLGELRADIREIKTMLHERESRDRHEGKR